MEALTLRVKADAEVERKRLQKERQRHDKARLAAIDEKTRRGIGAYRDKVEFTGSCAYCETCITRGVNAHLEHIMPIAKNGTNSLDNLVWACDKCNLLKSDKSFYRFLAAAKLNPDKVMSRLVAMGKFV